MICAFSVSIHRFFSDVIAEVFFAPSNNEEVQAQDDLGFGGEIEYEDTGNLIKSFLVYGIGECIIFVLHHDLQISIQEGA